MAAANRWAEAAEVWWRYASRPEEALAAFLRGFRWQAALRLCADEQRADLITTHVKPAVLDAHSNYLSDISEWQNTFETKTERLKVVRTNKLLLPKILEGEKQEQNDETGSILSGMSMLSGTSTMSAASHMSTSSNLSSSSGYSGYSSLSLRGRKQRKPRQKKKRVTAKEGGAHEEEYLVSTLKRVIPSSQTQEEVGSLAEILVHFGYIEKAKTLQEKFHQFLITIPPSLHLLVPQQPPPVPEGNLTQEENQQNKVDVEAFKLFEKVDWQLKLFD